MKGFKTFFVCTAFLSISGCLNQRAFNEITGGGGTSDTSSNDKRYLYIASGACYGGGVVTTAGLGFITQYDLASGNLVRVLADYSQNLATDLPADMADYDDDHLIVLIENGTTTSNRRVELVAKDGSGHSTLAYSSLVFTGILHSLTSMASGSFLISRTAAVSKMTSSFAPEVNPLISAPAGVCATSTTLITDAVELPGSGKILFAHAAAAQARVGLVSTAGACLAASSAPVATAFPTDILRHSSGKYLVSFGSTTAGSNSVYTYAVDETLNTLTPTQSYNNQTYVNGPSRLAEDTTTGDVYIANAVSTLNNVEKFSYNTTSYALTRTQNYPIIQTSGFTRCISGLAIGK